MDRRQVARTGRWAALLLAGAALAGCMTPQYSVRAPGYGPQAKGAPPRAGGYKTGEPYQVGGIWYVPHEQPNYDQTGIASWYGDAFNMKATANGEIFDMSQFSAAHTTLPLPSMVEVTNLDNGRKLTVRVNDRGPFVDNRIIDLSHAAARELGYDRAGLAHVRVRYLGPAPLGGPDAGVRYARATPPSSPSLMPAAARRPADEEIFDEAAQAAAAPKPLVAPPEPVAMSTLSPLPATPSSREVAAQDMPAPAAQIYRIQAGAFSDQDNARRAVTQLAVAGTATIEPMQRGGTTLYRVVLPGPADEAEAFAMRDRVAGIGFTDARVLRP
ncbi:MAG: septal ring lytic transglycosylase RlpA family protein [Caulobacterales bacterium]|jgi:rare lipoprotein A